MHKLKDLSYLLEDQVGDVVKKGDITPTELDSVYKAVKTMYYIETIRAMSEYNNSEDAYGRLASYANYGDRSYGRYNEMNYNRQGSYGYSRGDEKEHIISQLMRMRESATTEAERKALTESIRNLER